MSLFLMNMLGLSSTVHFAHITCPLQSRLSKADHAYLAYLMPQRQLNHLNGRKLDHRQVQASTELLVLVI
jgi:hypothetical protein